MIAALVAFVRAIVDSILARYGDRIGKTTATDAKTPPMDRASLGRRIRDRLRKNGSGR